MRITILHSWINSIHRTYFTIVPVMQFFTYEWIDFRTFFQYIRHNKFNIREIAGMHGYLYDTELNFRNPKVSFSPFRSKHVVGNKKEDYRRTVPDIRKCMLIHDMCMYMSMYVYSYTDVHRAAVSRAQWQLYVIILCKLLCSAGIQLRPPPCRSFFSRFSHPSGSFTPATRRLRCWATITPKVAPC